MNRLHATLKYFAALALCFLVRLIPHMPNVEPIMSAQVPAARRFGPLAGFGFGFASILIYDSITSGIGVWTWATAFAYGLVGLIAARFFRGRSVSRLTYVGFAFWSTIAYDALTGLTVGPLVWHQSFAGALVGQVPFTIMHLAGNMIMAAVVSPVLYNWFAPEPKRLPVGEPIGNSVTTHLPASY